MPIRTAASLFHVRYTLSNSQGALTRSVQVPGTDLDTGTIDRIIRGLAAMHRTPEAEIHLVCAERVSGVLEWCDDDEQPAQNGKTRRAAAKAN
jgi:hypothetical protein